MNLPARLMSKAEVAEYLNVSKKKIDRLVRAGKLPFVQLGHKKFDPADVRALIESRKFGKQGNPAAHESRVM